MYRVEDELCISFRVLESRGLIFASRLGINKTESIDGWVNSAAKPICIGMPRISVTYTVVDATDSKKKQQLIFRSDTNSAERKEQR